MNESLDNILIELNVIAVQAPNLNIWMYGNIEIIINGERPYINGEIVDTSVLLQSLKSDGEYFIFCCNCGFPECSGRQEGIKVFHKENTIKWIDNFINKTWIFDKNLIENRLNEINEEVKNFKKFFKEKEIDYVGYGYDL